VGDLGGEPVEHLVGGSGGDVHAGGVDEADAGIPRALGLTPVVLEAPQAAVPVRLPSTIGSHACSGSVKLYAVVTPFERKSSEPCSVAQ
jgi:hypothetical protein